MLKRTLKAVSAAIIIIAALSAAFAGCAPEGTLKGDRPLVLATIFPAYDFASHVFGDKADVRMLLPCGSESHSYEPTAKDIKLIGECDLFIFTGGESDTWIYDILDSVDREINTLKMMECVSTVTEEIKPGMEVPSGEEEEEEYDEHVWTSPKNAVLIIRAIKEKAAVLDPENSAYFSEPAESYIAEIETLDADFRALFAGTGGGTLIFGDRFPMRYFTDEYGLDYFAAFPGCSTESEPSMATAAYLTDTAKKLGVKAIFYIEFSNHRVADSIAEAAGITTERINTCHNVTKAQFDAGVTYLSLMRENLETLRKVL